MKNPELKATALGGTAEEAAEKHNLSGKKDHRG
jgi:hypothetical protein